MDDLRVREGVARTRWRAVAAAAVLVAAGVPTKWYDGVGADYVVGQAWDFFGTMAVFFAFRAAAPKPSARSLALSVWVLLMVNELVQRADGPVLHAMRNTRLGGVVLGSSFGMLDVLVISLALVLVVPMDRRWVSTKEAIRRAAIRPHAT